MLLTIMGRRRARCRRRQSRVARCQALVVVGAGSVSSGDPKAPAIDVGKPAR
jgi:hypothetical protein